MTIHINDLLKRAVAASASDIHIKANAVPLMRVNGELLPLPETEKVSQEEPLDLAFQLMSNRQKRVFKERLELDVGYTVPELGRFRANIFQQRGSVGLVLRIVPPVKKSFAELNLPAIMTSIADEPRGLILVTGTTGSGKSTTLASMIDWINMKRKCRIVTIEDPIEFIHEDKKAFITQREVETDTHSFADAFRSALRQDPDVILVGEMRDHETIETALMAAETGHLVLSTLHTIDATETITRIVSSFPAHQHLSVRLQLAGILKAVISMRLISTRSQIDDTGRIPAVEILRSTGMIRDHIINETKTQQIRDVLKAGFSEYGMQTFDQSIFALYEREQITYDEAVLGSSNPDEFRMRAAGIRSASEHAAEEDDRLRRPT